MAALPPAPAVGRPWHWLLPLLAGFAAAGLARMTGDPAPYGAALPVPPRLITSEGIGGRETDVLGHKLPPAFLEHLAPQPDGTPPLRYTYVNRHAGFSIKHPTGTEVTQLDFRKPELNEVDAIGKIHFNQPLLEVKYILPARRSGEKVTEFIARMQHELKQLGWQVLHGADRHVELPQYRMERLEFLVMPEKKPGAAIGAKPAAQEMRIWYVGPLEGRLLLVEFTGRPEQQELCRRQAAKIIASLKPGPRLAEAMLKEDPGYASEGEQVATEPGA